MCVCVCAYVYLSTCIAKCMHECVCVCAAAPQWARASDSNWTKGVCVQVRVWCMWCVLCVFVVCVVCV